MSLRNCSKALPGFGAIDIALLSHVFLVDHEIWVQES